MSDTVQAGALVRATEADLPPPVAAALRAPDAPRTRTVTAAGIPFATYEWGDPSARPVLLVHGVTASAGIWWRTAPALAAAGFAVTALDQPGHGATGHWTGHHRFRDNAADLAAFIRAAGPEPAALAVIGHSWGAMTVAALPAIGLRPERLVLLDPPAVRHAVMVDMVASASERPYADLTEALMAVGGEDPRWSFGDVLAKARALTQLDAEAARSVLVDNGDWDGGLADLSDPAAAGVPVWIVRGDPAAGGLLPDEALPALARCIGPGRILTIEGAAHSPQRLHPEATVAALLAALRADATPSA